MIKDLCKQSYHFYLVNLLLTSLKLGDFEDYFSDSKNRKRRHRVSLNLNDDSAPDY